MTTPLQGNLLEKAFMEKKLNKGVGPQFKSGWAHYFIMKNINL